MLNMHPQRQRAVNAILVVILLSILMSLSTNSPARIQSLQNLFAQALYPFQFGASWVTGTVTSGWEFVVDVRNVFQENQRLKVLVEKYTGIEHQLTEVRLANRRLRELLAFQEEAQFSVTPAQVIGRNPSSWFSTITIDRGSFHGIQVDMPVVNHQGLVGKVIQVSTYSSKVQLIISSESGTSGIVQRTRDNGVVIGLSIPVGYCRITRLPVGSEVELGDLIISSDLTGVFPRGLVIGRVVEVDIDYVTLERSALIKPEVDFERLEEVLVITNYERKLD